MNAALLALAALAQAPTPQDTVVLKPIVVTATRVPVPADAVTAAVTVISGAALRERGIRTVADALRGTVGTAVVETAGYGSVTSLFVRGGESDYVKVLLDGVPLNLPGGAYNLAHLTTDDVERIEVVRGPVSVLYGSDAVAGVIQIFTRTGAGRARIEAEAGRGSRGQTRWGATLSGEAAGGRVRYSAAGSRFAADGLFPVNSGYRSSVVTARVQILPDRWTDAAVTWRYRDNLFRYPTDGAGQVVDANQHATDLGPTIGLDLGRRLSERFELGTQLGIAETDGRLSDAPDGPGDTTGVYRFASRDRVQRRSAEVRANWRSGPAATITAGVAFEDSRLRATNACEANFGGIFDCSSPPMDTARSTRGAFVQVLTGTSALSANVGARVDDSRNFGTFVTWRGGLAWRLDDATRLRGSVGTGFKEPTFFENFATGFTSGNPALAPERSFSWEGGIEHTFPGTAVAVEVTYFDQRFRNLIVYDGAQTPNFVNVAEVQSRGLEVGIAWAVGRGLAATIRYTYLDTRVLNGGGDPTFVTGRRLIRRPANALQAELTADLGGRGRAGLEVRFVGDRDDLDFSTFPAQRVTLAPGTRVAVSGEHLLWEGRGARPSLSLVVRAENLLDDRSREVANFPAQGRTLFAGARLVTFQPRR